LQLNGKSIFAPGEYLTHLEAAEAVRFIHERDRARPFFLYVPFTAPHSPMQAPQATIEKYAALPLKSSRRVYAAMVDEVDQAIGAILGALDDEGLTKDTIVLFFSDNGGSNIFGGVNTPLRGQKGETWEGGIRVPAVLRWPAQLAAGGTMDQMTTAMDVAPTLARAAGIPFEPTRPIDGQDMWPALSNGQPTPRQSPVAFASEIPIPGLIHLAIFDGPWKLVQILREGQTEIRLASFLFEIRTDPYERHDVAADHPDQVERLSQMLREWRRQHPMAGTRGTLVAHPGWVAPKDWAEAIVPARLLQSGWKNELPFSQELLDATADRGVLVDPEQRKALLEAERERNRQIETNER